MSMTARSTKSEGGSGGGVFVDTGAWVALAVRADPLHAAARETFARLAATGERPVTSVPVVIETFTFLDRRGSRSDASAWRQSLAGLEALKILDCTGEDLAAAWKEMESPRLRRVSLVDATSFVLMRRHGLRRAFAFDAHFFAAGFLPA